MDIPINPVSGTSQQYTPPVPKASPGAAAAVAQTQLAEQQTATAIPPVTAASGSSASTVQDEYETALRQAALSFKNTYAISDQQFSIFKDASGKYITRYVSLRDGRVTYTPTPTLVRQLQPAAAPSRVTLSA